MGKQLQTIVQEQARRALCTFGERLELFACQIIVMGVAAATLIYGSLSVIPWSFIFVPLPL